MADVVTLLNPNDLKRNPDNPRLIFRQQDLDSLQQSIADQGILVPLTVFRDGRIYRILDGERRWRCAVKLGLNRVPAILQPKPDRLTNIMMMFAIHHARKDWDPLPTALKLEDLEREFEKQHGKKPKESQLAGLASLSRGEVRRLKKLLALPADYRKELLDELDKPRSEQVLTVDHVLETTTAAGLLKKRGIVDEKTEDKLRRSLLDKFKSGVIKNTVAPRKLARIARAVAREELPLGTAQKVIGKLIRERNYDIDAAFRDSVEQVDFEHSVDQQVTRLFAALEEHQRRQYQTTEALAQHLKDLVAAIRKVLGN